MWEPNPEPLTVEITNPEKRKKFKGIKTFMAYHVIPTVSALLLCEAFQPSLLLALAALVLPTSSPPVHRTSGQSKIQTL